MAIYYDWKSNKKRFNTHHLTENIMRLSYTFALAASLLPLLAAAQPSGPLLLLTPSTTSLNLTAGEIAPLAFALQNLGEEYAINVTLSIAASGCAQLLGWNNAWESVLAVNVGDLAPGSVKRVVIPVRCEGKSGSIAATVYGDNADPAYAVVRVSTRGDSNLWLFASLPLSAVAVLASAYALRRAKKREKKLRSSKRGQSTWKRSTRG